MRFGNGTLASEMFISRDLICQLVLFDRSRITRRLRRPRSVLVDFVVQIVSHGIGRSEGNCLSTP